jgi:hypothetical protein
MSGVTIGGQYFKYDSQEIDLRLTAKGLTEDDLKELGEGLRTGKFRRLKKLHLVSIFTMRYNPSQ